MRGSSPRTSSSVPGASFCTRRAVRSTGTGQSRPRTSGRSGGVAGGIAAIAVRRLTPYKRRVAVTTLFGLFAWLSTDVGYWNWYGFPGPYIVASLVDRVGGFLLAGLVVGWLARPSLRNGSQPLQ